MSSSAVTIAPSPLPADSDRAPPALSIVLAVLNERGNLPTLLAALESAGLPSYELIFVDDGSEDGTREYLDSVAARDVRVRRLYHDGKQTTVRAQNQGVVTARGEFVVVMDSDLQHPTDVVPQLVARLRDGASLAVASRYLPGGSTGDRSRARAFLSRGAGVLAKLFFAPARRTSDPVSGFFAFRRDIYRPLDPDLRGYKLLLFVLAMNRPRPVSEVAYRFRPRVAGRSKVTQGFAFLRVFLREVGQARRFARRAVRSLPAVPAPAPSSDE